MKIFHLSRRSAGVIFIAVLACLPLSTWARRHDTGVPEVVYPKSKFKMLDNFEGHQLSKADKAFAGKNYRLAAKLYDQFILEYAKSKAVPYALCRKGRCLQKDNKKYHAIKEYDEVLDYFPDDVYFATAALYFKGECYWQAQDYKKAYIAWKEIAEDEEYRKQPWAGTALKRLADNLIKNKKYEDAVKYYEMVLLNFRNNLERKDIESAIDQIVYHHVRRDPDEEEFRQFYVKAGRLRWHRQKVSKTDVGKDWNYWKDLRNRIWHFGKFKDHQVAERRRHYKFWANRLRREYPTSDDFQIDVARMDFYATDSRPNYYRRLDALFKMNHKPANHNERVAKWIRLFSGSDEKVNEYYDMYKFDSANGKHTRDLMWNLIDMKRTDLAKKTYPKIKLSDLSFDDRFRLLQRIWDRLRDYSMARNLFGKLGLEKVDDGKKAGCARWFWHKDGKLALQTYDMMKNQKYADYCRMEYFQWSKQYDKGIEAAKRCTLVDKYANNAWWRMAEMYGAKKKWAEAIKAYRQCQNQPDNLFRIAECYKNWNKLGNAIQQLVEIENFFGAKDKRQGSRSAWVQATYYRHFGRDALENKALWKIMGKYPNSGESRRAHERLEAKGLRIKGAVDKKMWEDLRDAEKNLLNEPNL